MNEDQKITYFGLTNFRNQGLRFGIKKIDRRKHMYIVGKTGMGKTTLLENLAMQDIQNGEGIAFIDPHGETAFKLLNFVPKERINDVIYLNPADLEFPVGLNVMESVDLTRRHFVASGLMAVFKKIFGPDVWSARMEYILGNTILALLEYPDATLLSINPMLAVKEFRKKVVENVKDPVIKAFWTQEFAKYTERFAAEATPAIQNKVGQFTSNPIIRNIVGQAKSTFDFRKAMDEKKIIIINIAKGSVGEENMKLLGSMIVTKIYLAAMSRVDIADESKRNDFFLYVDEFQNFATESFADILSEARKYRLNLTMANQFMAQLAEEVRDAVIGNVGTMLAFRVGAEDAEFLEKEFGPEFMATDLVNPGFAQIYLKLMIDGVASRPFSAQTLPPIKNNQPSYREEILAASRKNYGVSRASVEDQIKVWSESMSGIDSVSGDVAGEKSKSKFLDDRSFKPSMPLFDAVCIVCGKKTQVPFEPDPARPVFCKEHIGMASKYPRRLVQTTGLGATPLYSESASLPAGRQGSSSTRNQEGLRREEGNDVESARKQFSNASSVQKPHTVSLRDLSKHTAEVSKKFIPRDQTSTKKQDNLSALREALKKSLEAKKTQSMPSAEPSVKVESKSSAELSSPSKGTIKLGDKIEL